MLEQRQCRNNNDELEIYGPATADAMLAGLFLCLRFPPRLSRNADLSGVWYGQIGAVRISNIVRSATWDKATSYSDFDQLITFGEGSPPGSGSVQPIVFVCT